jgi:hypothetical protein
MLFSETVAVYYENHTENTNTLCGQKTQSVPHRDQPINPVYGNSRCLLSEP